MKKELGKWLMDIAKYVATAVVISSVFGDAEPYLVYIGGASTVLLSLGVGLFLYSGKSINEIKKLRKK